MGPKVIPVPSQSYNRFSDTALVLARKIRPFKIEAVRLVRDRGVSVAQASRDLGVHNQARRA